MATLSLATSDFGEAPTKVVRDGVSVLGRAACRVPPIWVGGAVVDAVIGSRVQTRLQY